MKKFIVICFIFLPFLIFNCDSDNKSDCTISICTDEFRYITVLIKQTTDNTAVILTSYKVLRISDNKDITIKDDSLDHNLGYYPIVNDSQLAMLRNSTIEVEFQGYIQDTLVIKKRFVVAADCCHVSLVSGESIVYI